MLNGIITTRRPLFRIGGSLAFTVPFKAQTGSKGEDVTIAIDGSIMIVDLKGNIPEDILAEFLNIVRPKFHDWLLSKSVQELLSSTVSTGTVSLVGKE